MDTTKVGLGLAAVIVAVIAVITLLSGGDDDSSAEAKQTDGAFVAEMVVHHESAIEMAEIATERAQHPEINQLAEAIIATQSKEIRDLEAIHERLFGEPVAKADHASLGLPEHEMGMEADLAELEAAKPFDREFIDMMVPHHQSPIRMARVQLSRGEDGELKAVSEAIIAAQSRESGR